MRKDDPRDSRENHPLKHHSARGKPPRNSNNFTRGGQLVTHDWRMWIGAAKLPALIWFAIVVVTYWIIMFNVMGEHEIQLVSWRIYASVWDWMELNPFKPMNIVLADNSLRRVPIGYIFYVPDVQVAWAKAIRALMGSFFGGTLLALAPAFWFITHAQRHGSNILDERHERGALLVPLAVLIKYVRRFNTMKFEEAAAKLFPGLTPKQVLKLPFAARQAAGLHHPYTLGGVPYPYGLEQNHTIVIGTTGSGKTTQLKNIVAEMRQRGDSAVVFDLTGSFIESFYDEKTDIILNPGDERCPCWSVFEDCTTQAEFTAAAQALIPHDGGGGDPFWVASARLLFVQMCMKLQEHGLTTNADLVDTLIKADLKTLHKYLVKTSAAPLVSNDAAKMAMSIRAVFATNADALSTLPQDGEFFSIREWVLKKDKPGSILFVSARYVDLPLYKTLLTLFLDIAVITLMTLPRTNRLRTWYMFDELGALHRLPAIENGLQTARGFGGAMILGVHSFARLQAVYGKEGAENMGSLIGSKLILKTGDRKTAETCSEFIGFREVRQMDEAYSYGNNPLRDGATLTPRKEITANVIADDIARLPSLQGYVVFPDGFPAARVKLKWRSYPDVAAPFITRPLPPRLARDDGNPLSQIVRPKPQAEGGGGGPEDPTVPSENGKDSDLANELREALGTGDRQAMAARASDRLARMIEEPSEPSQLDPPLPVDLKTVESVLDGSDAGKGRDHAPETGTKEAKANIPITQSITTRDERRAAARLALMQEIWIDDDGDLDQDMDIG